jgi:hypothetical protein
MMRKHAFAICILALSLTGVSCQKLDQPLKPTGPLTYETAKFPDAIPQNYGPLIGVTQNPANAAWVGLWFQRTDGTIAAVFVNVQEGRIYDKALTIARK